jgi:aminobenzoyl-glutamate transport protein
LGAAIFYAIGRHPLAGLAAAFFGVSAGFAANISLTLSDVILAGITEQAARMIDPEIVVLATSNLFFMWAATIILTIIGYFVTEKIVVPKLGEYKPSGDIDVADISSELSAEEKRGLKFAGWSFLGAVIFILLLVLPESAPLRNPETGAILDRHAPFMGGLVAVIMILFLAPALGFGIGSKTIKSNKDVVNSMTKSMQSMGAYLVLAFFAAQFINYFAHSNLGVVLSMNGSVFLQNIGLTGVPLIISFVLLCAFLNMFMGSSSAKWLIMAPIFVPMFMDLGYDPAFTQLAFRVGDTVTNIITPMMSFFALVVVFAEKYDKNAGIGTIISMMLPYSLIALLGLSAALIVWYLTGLPIGVGGYIHLP